MLVGCVLLAVAALVVVSAAVCWLAGVQLIALVKIALAACAVLLTVAGVLAVATDLLVSAGYRNSNHVDPQTPPLVTQPATDWVFSEQEQARWMHQHTVGVFIEGPGFGMGRMLTSYNYADIIGKPATPSDNSVGPYARETGNGPVHNAAVNNWMGAIQTNNPKETWKVRKVHLVGLVKHPEPVVYLTDRALDMKETKDVPTREPDAFEKTALESIKNGKDIVIENNEQEMRVVGPIYAGNSCVKCHEQKGQLLGAFTYRLERVPNGEEKDKAANTPPP